MITYTNRRQSLLICLPHHPVPKLFTEVFSPLLKAEKGWLSLERTPPASFFLPSFIARQQSGYIAVISLVLKVQKVSLNHLSTGLFVPESDTNHS